ncbi:hypothetical protein PF002_g28796 [Phytophthora fragariae]|uniref:Uncharacterized protein n=1 Tax=Phytophthora fragariae TaxID=53985 RepID=A0A6A3VZQ9_9STRA|nr:hypothetical protein PF002_g28796 [Phytophthora fragariae]
MHIVISLVLDKPESGDVTPVWSVKVVDKRNTEIVGEAGDIQDVSSKRDSAAIPHRNPRQTRGVEDIKCTIRVVEGYCGGGSDIKCGCASDINSGCDSDFE